MMKRSRTLLIVAASLFALWIGYLAFLALTASKPDVLSRPQFLMADLYVVAEVPAHPHRPDRPAHLMTVKQIVWSKDPEDAKRTQFFVAWPALRRASPTDWKGPGEYVLALSRTDDANVFLLTPLPRTPGYAGAVGRVYPATSQTLEQVERLKQEFHP